MAQEWDPLSKANKSGIIIEMGKKLKVGVTVSFVHFSSCRVEQDDVRFQKFVLIIDIYRPSLITARLEVQIRHQISIN
jgi:hypothetical protein